MSTIKPGRELDQLVAEKVMGWKVFSHWEPGIIKHLVDENQCEIIPPEFKPYSTDISAAWEVVEKLRHLNPTIHFEDTCLSWSCSFNSGLSGKGWSHTIDIDDDASAPLVVCLAALKSVGYEIS